MGAVSAIIINYNKRELLTACLVSVKGQSTPLDTIIVVDNHPIDDLRDMINKDFPDVKIIKNKNNLGFATACNQGINMAKAEFILLLNNDAVLDENFLKYTLDAMKMDEKIGLAGGKVLSWDARFIDSAGQFLAKSRKIIDRGYKEPDNGQYDTAGFVFGVSASVVLYRRAMLEDIKEGGQYLDENFGFFYEDMDLAWRAQKKGWEAYYQPKAIAYHKRGATTKTERPKIKFLESYYIPCLNDKLALCAIRNRYLMMFKNDSVKAILRNLPAIIWYEIKQAFYIIFFRPRLIIDIVNNKRLF